MKDRLLLLIKNYLCFLLIFILQKPLFMAYYHSLYGKYGGAEWLNVMWHGLPLDLSLSGYLSLLPGILLILSVWISSSKLRYVWKGYYVVVALLLAVIFVVDLGLYQYWGFRLDTTPLFYFFSSPKDAFASASIGMIVMGVLAMLLSIGLLIVFFHYCLYKPFCTLKLPKRRIYLSVFLLLATALMIIPIRGGFTVSTMNTGKVYYSSELVLNHAATNPAFSLMESASKQTDFAKQYRFLDADKANDLFADMVDASISMPDSAMVLKDTLFTSQRPNILMIILESFSSHLMQSLGGEANVAVSLDSLANEGVLFTNFYANSFRTDRGLIAVLSGYPAQPTTSIMKYPRKTQSLPSICNSLRGEGYTAKYYYGGDADFTNMRSYLMSSGFESILSDQDFSLNEKMSKWGAHDHLVFDRLLDELKNEDTSEGKLYYRVLQTSSSHEPFEVPYQRLENPKLNAFAYTDSVVGNFISQFKKLPQWDNTVVILVPDHLGAYPDNLSNLSPSRYQIPLLMVGGAVKEAKRIDTFGSQHDLAATLLAQLGIAHQSFVFSKNMLDERSPHFAFFTIPDAFGIVTENGHLVYDSQAGRVDSENNGNGYLEKGQAYLQKLYDDLADR